MPLCDGRPLNAGGQADPRFIDRATFEAGLARARALGSTPEEGLFGPRSVLWRLQREASVFLGAGAALLLQTAHPWVAQAVVDHSKALKDPLGRYYRTFRPVFAMIYGTADQAMAQARAVRAIHERIEGTLPDAIGAWPAGTRYGACEAHAALWVHATLWHTAIAVRERLWGLPDPATLDAFHEETRRFALLFGVPEDLLPANWAAFEAYVAGMAASDRLAVGTAGRLIGGYFLGRMRGAFGRLLPEWYRALTASLLPPRLATAFGLPVDARSAAEAAAAWTWLRRFQGWLPAGLRHVGPYQEAMRRLSGREPGLWVGTLNRVWLGRPRLEP